jgi:phosphatidylserine decarboxylase
VSCSQRLAVLAQYLVPKLALTRLMGWLASRQAASLSHVVIRRFVAHYGVNMAEAANPQIDSYASFNEFFTRPLRDGARPQASATYLCPVDGAISQFGAIEADQIFQAKGHHYSTQALVGGDAALAAQFHNGAFATLYLSPKDYHRIHMPCTGRLRRMIHIPGDLFSVNPTTARAVPGLFARNERVVCVFDLSADTNTPPRQFVLALVGATIVGSIATVWHGLINPPRPGQIREWSYHDTPVVLVKGAEMGRFLLGSTVVLLFPKELLQFSSSWAPGRSIQMGEAMGTAR